LLRFRINDGYEVNLVTISDPVNMGQIIIDITQLTFPEAESRWFGWNFLDFGRKTSFREGD